MSLSHGIGLFRDRSGCTRVAAAALACVSAVSTAAAAITVAPDTDAAVAAVGQLRRERVEWGAVPLVST